MIGNHSHGTIRDVFLAVLRAGPFGNRRQQRRKEIAVIIALDSLSHRSQPFQPHPRIDTWLGQRVEGS